MTMNKCYHWLCSV